MLALKISHAPVILFLSEFCQRFSYWGIQSILVLYLAKELSFSQSGVFILYGAFTALTFAVSILGGIIADQFLGSKRMVLIGIVGGIAGNTLLGVFEQRFLYISLSLIVCGTGLFLPNNSNFLGDFYGKNDQQRNKGFTCLYVATNAGGLLGPIFYGIISLHYNWRNAFLLSSAGLIVCFVLFLLSNSIFFGKADVVRKNNNLWIYVSLFFLLLFAIELLKFPSFSAIVLASVGIGTLIFIIIYLYKHKEHQKTFLLIVGMIFLVLFFFSFEFQFNSSLLLFADQYLNRHIFGIEIPTPALAALEPLFVILFSPFILFFCKKYKYLDQKPFLKLAMGLILEAVGFLLFSMLSSRISISHQLVSINWFVLGAFFLGAGEICLMPTVIATITRLAPKKMTATLIGMLYLSLSFSGYFTGLIARLTGTQHRLISSSMIYTNVITYTQLYKHIFWVALILGCSIALPQMLSFDRKNSQL